MYVHVITLHYEVMYPFAGDHVIVGSYDCKLSWFDLDLSTKPFKTLRYWLRTRTCITMTLQL